MQVPEKLALIGGSILLSSTLIFTLKSQASSIIPHVDHSISHVFDHIGDTQHDSDFNAGFQQAQSRGWQTGTWGSAKYYIDDQQNMHVGSGQLEHGLAKTVGIDKAPHIASLSFGGPVQAPSDSQYLLSTDHHVPYVDSNLSQINHLTNLDTSHVTNMRGIFYSDTSLKGLDWSQFDTSHVVNMKNAFTNDVSLSNINLGSWQTSSVTDMSTMFSNDVNLSQLNLNHTDTSHAKTDNMFGGPWSRSDHSLASLDLGQRVQLGNAYLPPNDWQNDSQRLSANQLQDGNSHPGTWTRQ